MVGGGEVMEGGGSGGIMTDEDGRREGEMIEVRGGGGVGIRLEIGSNIEVGIRLDKVGKIGEFTGVFTGVFTILLD
jgi:hypothetical protein